MISLDANVLVRLLTNDEPRQAQKARIALDLAMQTKHRIWVSVIVVCELVWVLQRLYGYDKAQVIVGLNALLKFPGLEMEQPKAIRQAVDGLRRQSADFADILLGHLSEKQGADHVLTFDRKAAKLATHKLLV